MKLFSWFRREEKPAVQPVVRSRYDAAQTTPLNQRHWAQSDWLSADAALHPGIRRTLRVRARYEAANNPYLAGMLSTLASDTIGTGPRLQIDVQGADDAKLKAVERAVDEWSCAIDLAGKLRRMRRARALDGEAFAVMQTNPRLGDGVQLDIKLVEADQVANPTWILELGAIDGLRLDDAGNVVEWHIMRHHPGSLTWNSNQGDWVPADRVLHWANIVRPGQHRGVGEVVPALELFAHLRRFTNATVTAAETAANFAALIHTNSPGSDNGAAEMPAWETMPIVNGTIMSLPDQWDATQLRPEHPTTTYAEFEKRLVNQIARALDMPYIVAAMDSSAASYSSMRGDYLVYRKAIGTLRADLERHVLDRLLGAWLDEAALVPGLIPRGLPPISQWTWSWTWDGFEHVDPSKEASALETALRTHTTTLAAEYQKKGKDWRQELNQRAQEIAVMKDLGLFVDLEPKKTQSEVAAPAE